MNQLAKLEAAVLEAETAYRKLLGRFQGPLAVPIKLREECTRAWERWQEARAALLKAKGI